MIVTFIFGVLILLTQFYTIYLVKQEEIDKKVEEIIVKQATEEEKKEETKAMKDFNEIMNYSIDKAKETNR